MAGPAAVISKTHSDSGTQQCNPIGVRICIRGKPLSDEEIDFLVFIDTEANLY